MSAIVRLDDIVEALEMQMDEYSSFLDCETGQVETVSHDLLHEAEELHEEDEPDAETIWIFPNGRNGNGRWPG